MSETYLPLIPVLIGWGLALLCLIIASYAAVSFYLSAKIAIGAAHQFEQERNAIAEKYFQAQRALIALKRGAGKRSGAHAPTGPQWGAGHRDGEQADVFIKVS